VTRWPARPRCPRSSTRRPWSPPASTSSSARTRSSRAPNAQLAAIVGAITLLYGAIVGCAKDDIKKALAASTMSQIGYMMLAAGLGPIGYAFAIFHLLTHGFFKAGMFLGAGSVMHGMNDQVDMRRFGRLSGAMKVTWMTFGLGWLAILGIPPFAGFWSKDKIIESAFAVGAPAAGSSAWPPSSVPASPPSTCRGCSS
jgi:NADH:ubiquinone oxidoreductase subunit 5 (subunit L)/multisubunit Na+/H+ antiporter MnhA subunit